MKVPNANQAIVPKGKLTDYLLSPTHPYGRHKARLFAQFGFSVTRWETFAAALRKHVQDNEVSASQRTRLTVPSIL